jgi:hypothetical protein
MLLHYAREEDRKVGEPVGDITAQAADPLPCLHEAIIGLRVKLAFRCSCKQVSLINRVTEVLVSFEGRDV